MNGEFPIEVDGATIEQDDGGLWVSLDGKKPYWIGPRALKALKIAFGAENFGGKVDE